MSKNLTIISYPKKIQSLFEDISLTVSQRSRNGKCLFARFQKQGDGQLRRALRTPGITNLPDGTQDIEYLDLVGHGLESDGFALGDDIVIGHSVVTNEFRDVLNAMLPSTTTIRLLGCLTGSGWAGLAMLQAVSAVLKNRRVLGTTTIIRATDFDPGGLKTSYAGLIAFDAPHPLTGVSLKPAPADAATSAAWLSKLPPGYTGIGRAHPIARAERVSHRQGARVALACGNRLVMVEDKPEAPPLLFQWDREEPAPQLSPQLRRVG